MVSTSVRLDSLVNESDDPRFDSESKPSQVGTSYSCKLVTRLDYIPAKIYQNRGKPTYEAGDYDEEKPVVFPQAGVLQASRHRVPAQNRLVLHISYDENLSPKNCTCVIIICNVKTIR